MVRVGGREEEDTKRQKPGAVLIYQCERTVTEVPWRCRPRPFPFTLRPKIARCAYYRGKRHTHTHLSETSYEGLCEPLSFRLIVHTVLYAIS